MLNSTPPENAKPVQRYQVDAALQAAQDEDVDRLERSSMLLDIATTLHRQAHSAESLQWAAELYEHSAELCPQDQLAQQAKARARAITARVMAGSLELFEIKQQMLPLVQTRDQLIVTGDTLEAAHCDMHLGIMGQQLSQAGELAQGEAVAAYQRALQVLNKRTWPCEFAIMQCNLASLYLQREPASHVHESLAIQSLESALGALDRDRHPNEYAMVQNNLGNALQSIASETPEKNLLRAVCAYDEALKIRTRTADPMGYAGTLANKASCLSQLPDEASQNPGMINQQRLRQSLELFQEAATVMESIGDHDRAEMVHDMSANIAERLESDLGRT